MEIRRVGRSCDVGAGWRAGNGIVDEGYVGLYLSHGDGGSHQHKNAGEEVHDEVLTQTCLVSEHNQR